MTPSRDDNETTSAVVSCPVCGATFSRVRRQTYCSSACKQVAWRARHRSEQPPSAVAASRRRADTVYQCGQCDSRYLGEQWCTDCTRPCRSLGAGGLCGHCGEPLTVAELLAGEVLT